MKKIRNRLTRKKILIIDAVLFLLLAVCLLIPKTPEKVQGLTLDDSTFDSAEISWDASSDAKAYHVYRSEDGKNFDYLKTTRKTSYTDKKLITGKTYYYAVSASNGIKRTGPNTEESIEAEPSLDTPVISISTDSGSVEISIREVEGATGYRLFRNKKKIADLTDLSYVDEDAENDTKYTYKVKAFRDTGADNKRAYSDFSRGKKAELISAGTITAEVIEDKDLEISWSPNADYTEYELYNNEDLLTETSATSYTIEGIEAGNVYNIKLIGKSDDTTSPETLKSYEIKEEEMTNEDAIDAACDWGVKIAEDDSFSYGTGQRAHRYGCYFCGTNTGPNMNIKGKSKVNGHSYQKTYCCNPFVSACFAHGAGDEALLKACRRGKGVAMTEKSFTRYGHWKKYKKPAYGKLKRGDVLVKANHVALYIGDGQYVQASGEGWGAKTISVSDLKKSRYGQFQFIMRYTGNGRGTMLVAEECEVPEEAEPAGDKESAGKNTSGGENKTEDNKADEENKNKETTTPDA